MALSGRVHVNRFLRGNYFSGLNVIHLNSPLVKLLPVINMVQVMIPTECGNLVAATFVPWNWPLGGGPSQRAPDAWGP